jgi:ribose 5-phosphate isomerase A
MAVHKAGPVVSDNGNFVIDAPFPSHMMEEPYALLQRIKMLTGVVEVGLFCHMAKAAYFGNEDGTVVVRTVADEGQGEGEDPVDIKEEKVENGYGPGIYEDVQAK